MELSLRNASAMAVNLSGAASRLRPKAEKTVRDVGRYAKELAVFFCPVDTGFMRDHIRLEFSPSGLAFELGWRVEDFVEAGLEFYVVYVVYGTSRQAAQDPLTPAFEEALPVLRARLRADLAGLDRSAA